MDKSKILHSEFYKGYTLLIKGEYRSNVLVRRGMGYVENDVVYLYYKRFVGNIDVNSNNFVDVPNINVVTVQKPLIEKSFFKKNNNQKSFEELVSEKFQLIIGTMRNKIDLEIRDQEVTDGLLDSLKGI